MYIHTSADVYVRMLEDCSNMLYLQYRLHVTWYHHHMVTGTICHRGTYVRMYVGTFHKTAPLLTNVTNKFFKRDQFELICMIPTSLSSIYDPNKFELYVWSQQVWALCMMPTGLSSMYDADRFELYVWCQQVWALCMMPTSLSSMCDADRFELYVQWNLSKTTARGPVLTDHYREVAALQR